MPRLIFISFSFVFLLIICPNDVYGQNQEGSQAPPDNQFFLVVDQMPVFPGGYQGIKDTIKAHLVYPSNTKNVKGRVILSFIINEQGNVEDIKIVRSLGELYDKEAIRVTSLMSGKWTPGKHNGKPAKVLFTIPVEFNP